MDQTLTTEILEAIGISDIPQEEQDELLDRVTELVMQNLLISAIENLPENQTDAYTSLIGTNPDPDTVFEFFRNHIENFDEIVTESVTSVAEVFRK